MSTSSKEFENFERIKDALGSMSTKGVLLAPCAFIPNDELLKKWGYVGVVSKPFDVKQIDFRIQQAMSEENEGRQDSLVESATVLDDQLQLQLQLGRLLLVEDNRTNQLVAEMALNDLGFEVVIANHGAEAVEFLKRCSLEERPLAILMDCHMPVMDGYQAAKMIRETLVDYRDVPIIAVTANAMEADREKCLAHGMDDYMSKPMDEEILEKTLLHWGLSDSD